MGAIRSTDYLIKPFVAGALSRCVGVGGAFGAPTQDAMTPLGLALCSLLEMRVQAELL
jgi:hypothetical protein